MISNTNKKKGILAKLLEQCMKILLIKECKKISNIKIDIISSTTQIINGEIENINIFAKDVDYNELLFDEIELEAHHLKINFQIKKKELYFKKDPLIRFKVSLSENSIKTVLLSNNWDWRKYIISDDILNEDNLEVKLENDELLINFSDSNFKNRTQIEIKTIEGKIYLNNKRHSKTLQIPIEDKIHIKSVIISNNLINIFGHSSVSFDFSKK